MAPLNDLKRHVLTQRRDLLIEQYKAAHQQRNAALSAADKLTIDQMIKQLEAELADVEAELAALDAAPDPQRASQPSHTLIRHAHLATDRH